MTVRKYEEKDLSAMIQIWNEVVEDGIAFPQEELLTPESGRAFFAGQTLSCVAEEDDKVVGAVWTRIMDDYGHVDDDTPSFAISLYKEYRGKGIGTKMMRHMLELLKDQGYERASLAVQKANYAVKMYETVGFKTVDENAEEYIMVCIL